MLLFSKSSQVLQSAAPGGGGVTDLGGVRGTLRLSAERCGVEVKHCWSCCSPMQRRSLKVLRLEAAWAAATSLVEVVISRNVGLA